MSTFKNFVQCRVTTPITAAVDSIGLYAAVPPYTLPSEEGGLLVLTDSPTKPSKLEVISYTSRSALGLYGVTRGLEGTTAQAWTGPVYCYQSLLAGEFKTLLDSKADKDHSPAISDVTGLSARLSDIGDLSQLYTDEKRKIVAAINEAVVFAKGIIDGGGIGGSGGVMINDAAGLGDTTVVWSANQTVTTIQAAVDALVDGAPGALAILSELAAVLGNDENLVQTMITQLNNRVRFDEAQVLTAEQQLTACTNIGVGNPTRNFAADYAEAKL